MRKCFTPLVIAGLLAFATSAFANITATGTNTVSPTLNISATVQSAVGLYLATGAHCTIGTTTADYSLAFGNVDAMGINSGCGLVYAPVAGQTGATYYTDYTLTPVYSGQGSAGATITAALTTAPETGVTVGSTTSSPTAASNFTGANLLSASPTTLFTGITSGTTKTAYLGLNVATAAALGPVTAVVTYTAVIH